LSAAKSTDFDKRGFSSMHGTTIFGFKILIFQ